MLTNWSRYRAYNECLYNSVTKFDPIIVLHPLGEMNGPLVLSYQDLTDFYCAPTAPPRERKGI
jgi:hypothetical protein